MTVDCSLAQYLMDTIGLPRDTCNNCKVYKVKQLILIN